MDKLRFSLRFLLTCALWSGFIFSCGWSQNVNWGLSFQIPSNRPPVSLQPAINGVPQGFNGLPQGTNGLPQGTNGLPQGFNGASQGFDSQSVREAFVEAIRNVNTKRSIRSQTRVSTAYAPRVSTAAARHRFFFRSKQRSLRLTSTQAVFEEATKVLRTKLNLTPEQMRTAMSATNLKQILGDGDASLQQCEDLSNVTDCVWYSPYRTMDGTCNNIYNPTWGMATTCFERLLPQAYSDGISELRVSVSGRQLPNPRRISLEIHSNLETPTQYVTHMYMQWGQFLDHDISQSPLFVDPETNEPLTCCQDNTNGETECLPILLEEDDPFFSGLGRNCLENVRTITCATCSFGPREQINQLTAYIDASLVYGNSLNESRGLRTLDGTGRLRSQMNNVAGELLPESDSPANDECSFQDDQLRCFQTGDPRGNQHPALTSLHVVFLREHNRLARRLREINPYWDGETVYQEARRIVAAQMQMITYNEFMPLVIGQDKMKRYGLYVNHYGYTQYQDNVPATLVNEFSTAAFRFGHSLINSFFAEFGSNQQDDSGYNLRDMFLFPFGLYSGQLERILLGLTDSPSQKFDRHMVPDVTNHLYQIRGNNSGLDLASLNILRGRDHGLPGYIDYVRYCTGLEITSFRQLDQLFRRGVRQFFESIYENVADIDLFSGGLAERPNDGASVGPTFACIIAKQFYRLKYGDRFYFEHGSQTGSFTPTQLNELKKNTLARIICDNTEITEVQRYVMRFADNWNPIVDCCELPEMNLYAWRV